MVETGANAATVHCDVLSATVIALHTASMSPTLRPLGCKMA